MCQRRDGRWLWGLWLCVGSARWAGGPAQNRRHAPPAPPLPPGTSSLSSRPFHRLLSFAAPPPPPSYRLRRSSPRAFGTFTPTAETPSGRRRAAALSPRRPPTPSRCFWPSPVQVRLSSCRCLCPLPLTQCREQVVVALAGGEIIYFEHDATGALAEVDKKDTGHDISCLEIGAVPPGRQVRVARQKPKTPPPLLPRLSRRVWVFFGPPSHSMCAVI